jgi:triphosphoribosyl-dephospho-CoA synthase
MKDITLSDIPLSAQMACILEVSAPKPGNVSRFQDFVDTTYEHFLASGISIGKAARKAAKKGYDAGAGKLAYNQIRIGECILTAVRDSKKWHRGRNTNLGIAMLLIPLSAAYGASLGSKDTNDETVRKNIDRIIRESTFEDSIALFKAIRLAKPGGLGRVEKFDVFDKESLNDIKKENINLYHLMEISAEDTIAQELTTSMRITFEIGYPILMREYSKRRQLNDAIVQTYLHILSKIPDSLIKRKRGVKVAEKISKMATEVLTGGMSIDQFDKFLRDEKNSLNPGTTADLVTSSLMVALLKGVRP